MSGRSAYVRKKITEPKSAEKAVLSSRGWSKSSSTRISVNDGSIYDYPLSSAGALGTPRSRLPKVSDPAPHRDEGLYRPESENHGKDGGSRRGGSDNGTREGGLQNQGPMPDYAYARARKPVLKTDDISGIERSGFRSAVDKKSDNIRKGLTKAFGLGLKKKKEAHHPDRVPSLVTLRAHHYDSDNHDAIKAPAMSTHGSSSGMFDPDYHQAAASQPPMTKSHPSPPFTATTIKRWIGGGRPVQRWNKLRKDPELWDPNGDVLVYLGPKDQPQQLNPSFRLSSNIIEATESRILLTLLREGSTENDDGHINSVTMPPSPIGAPPMLRGASSYAQLERAGRTSPPISEDNIHADIDGQISYKMYFPVPANCTKDEAHGYAITTRNVFALLYNASLVGTSLFQALQDLLDRLDTYMQPEVDNVGTILNYLSTRGVDDVRNDPEGAVSILAWSETSEVRWEEGWREAFLHCAGMYSRLEDCVDYRHLTPITRALLERACLETQLRVQAAEERLCTFAYSDIWPTTGPAANGSEKAAADRLHHFFTSYYAKRCGTWPPVDTGGQAMEGEMWLTRKVAHMLQKDFGALYDYLVNRDIVWDESEMRSSRKWMMVSESGNKSFDADTEGLPLTDILIEFDNRMRFPHIPHPYPLVPDPISPIRSVGAGSSHGRYRKEKNAKQTPDGRTLERRIQLAYTEATNIYNLGSDFEHSDLIDNFVKFEKSDQIGVVDPSRARRGRWVLIYTILQTLASVSVDSPNVRFRDGVAYHLSPRLKGATRTPPWKSATSQAADASHELSHCWVTQRTWQNGADGVESDDSVASGGTDLALRLMRDRLQRFPRPPRSTASRCSNAGWQGSSRRSVRSSGTATPTMWGGSSAMSLSNFSDDATISSKSRMLSIPHNHTTYSHRVLPTLPPRSPRRDGAKDDRAASRGASRGPVNRDCRSDEAHCNTGAGGDGTAWPANHAAHLTPKLDFC
ncbi:hypothetical protein F4861DRAFT_167063 [Xylaria intraflava]|nr:hypothetical protein F4861DRAFT_167063 [Xylaria intraflava]